MVNEIKDKVIYMGGHLLNQAMVDYREKQHEQVEGIVGVTPYSPHKDKSINDKANAQQEGLAERILNNDFKAMQEADIFVFDVLNEGLGTIAELGILLGIRHEAETLLNYELSPEMLNHVEDILRKPVLVYCSDIRQGHGKSYEDPDRAEFSTNQFVYGMILSLTDGRGFISWDEVLEELEKLGGGI
ncbi:nucleoside 2-deoxyribosyltransferase [Staphylococcus phage ZCSS1]|uniref:Nucleoside 2-deoxyribosyltransferase n=1 Tax=Staphylococcus phage UHP46 TaxID=3234966 RepID=A0AB39C868_9CAUD|nr:nucleoside 2-deoxyribosyltransferase [Staphylococcus phage ZCSS1]